MAERKKRVEFPEGEPVEDVNWSNITTQILSSAEGELELVTVVEQGRPDPDYEEMAGVPSVIALQGQLLTELDNLQQAIYQHYGSARMMEIINRMRDMLLHGATD